MSYIPETAKCDGAGCFRVKGETNNWYVLVNKNQVISILPFDLGNVKLGNYCFCGDECLGKYLASSLRDSIYPKNGSSEAAGPIASTSQINSSSKLNQDLEEPIDILENDYPEVEYIFDAVELAHAEAYRHELENPRLGVSDDYSF